MSFGSRSPSALSRTVLASALPALALTLGSPRPASAAAQDTSPPTENTATADEPVTSPSSQPAATVEPPEEVWDDSNVEELPNKTYLFVGARYRGNFIPKFMLNIFVDEGKSIYSNTVGAEIEIRKNGFSIIPALSFAEYSTGDLLFKQKNSPDIPGNYGLVNSGMMAVYATVDLLWSTRISKVLDFEYGIGLGLGAVFGRLRNNWVFENEGGVQASNGKQYSPCASVGTAGSGCNSRDHRNSDVDKVGDYSEPSWFSGGAKPVIAPWISVPQIGLRLKPVKQFEARLGIGFSLTGFWFGLSANYGLEKKPVR